MIRSRLRTRQKSAGPAQQQQCFKETFTVRGTVSGDFIDLLLIIEVNGAGASLKRQKRAGPAQQQQWLTEKKNTYRGFDHKYFFSICLMLGALPSRNISLHTRKSRMQVERSTVLVVILSAVIT